MNAGPKLSVRPASGATAAVVLVLPGGRVDSVAPVRPWNLSMLRMVPFARAVHRSEGHRGVTVALLRYGVRGWNGEQAAPVADARWALAQLRAEHGAVPVVLLGHSMGGRTALRLVAEPDVVAVVALAPWLPPDESRFALGARRLLVVHGTADRWTDPAASRDYVEAATAAGADASWVPMPGAGHFMLRNRRRWRHLVTGFVAEVVDRISERQGVTQDESAGQTGSAAAPNLAGQDADLG